MSVKCNWHGVDPKVVVFGGFSLQIIIACLPTTGIDNLFAINLYINVILEYSFEISGTWTDKEEPGSDLIGRVSGYPS